MSLQHRLALLDHELTADRRVEGHLRDVAGQVPAARARSSSTPEGPEELAEQHRASELWSRLNELIGSRDGSSFREFAQGLALERLLEHANHSLRDLVPRYRLRRVAGRDLDLEAVDFETACQARSISSLSGGERFLVSLALALGLATLSGGGVHLGSLFVDEGLGALDESSWEVVLTGLSGLQATGRQIALTSHAAGLKERVGVGVQVIPQGKGCSKVCV